MKIIISFLCVIVSIGYYGMWRKGMPTDWSVMVWPLLTVLWMLQCKPRPRP